MAGPVATLRAALAAFRWTWPEPGLLVDDLGMAVPWLEAGAAGCNTTSAPFTGEPPCGQCRGAARTSAASTTTAPGRA